MIHCIFHVKTNIINNGLFSAFVADTGDGNMHVMCSAALRTPPPAHIRPATVSLPLSTFVELVHGLEDVVVQLQQFIEVLQNYDGVVTELRNNPGHCNDHNINHVVDTAEHSIHHLSPPAGKHYI